MEVVVVQAIDHGLRIRVVLVKNELSLAVPPEPVLHDVVGWDVQLAVFVRDAENFFLRLVPILALPEAVGPFAEEGSLPG